jgi:hypothetical protein
MEKKQAVPLLLAILVCDEIIRDERSRKETLVGLFNTIHARAFPCVHSHLNVFVSLTNGHGVAPAELRLVARDTGQTLASLHGSVEFPTPLAVVHMNFEINNVTFPKAGRYSFDFFCRDELLASRPFEVVGSQEPQKE